MAVEVLNEPVLPALRREEQIALRLRALYEARGYSLFRMGSFEEYDLYMQNRPFLTGEDIITFTSADGRLMALKPDVTLSIVKNTPAGQARRVYYSENVFRRSRRSGEYREIHQMGLEYIGGEGEAADEEILCLAAQSLAQVGGAALDVSHMGAVEAFLAPFGAGQARADALAALRGKSPHGMREAAKKAGLCAADAESLAELATISHGREAAMPAARRLAERFPPARACLDRLESLCRKVDSCAPEVRLRVDFSILNDADYYNGIIFQGFVGGIPAMVLSGGRYDGLPARFGKPQGAVGFAVHLNALGAEQPETIAGAPQREESKADCEWLNVALPKGRLGAKAYALLEKAGLPCGELSGESRKLVLEDEGARVRYFLVKPSDVDIYVERGAADIGVAGRDVLLESGAAVLELMDLGFGACRIVVAGRQGFAEDHARALRVATKYPAVARAYYAAQSRSVEIIKLHGSIELAPLLGISDVIVDIVETGSTLRENNLAVLEEVAPSSARLIANCASWRFKRGAIQNLLDRLGELL